MRIDHKASSAAKKAHRTAAVGKIVVTVTRADGTKLNFDGDEVSQGRLDRFSRGALKRGLSEVPWRMADNTTMMVTPTEMEEAWMLGGEGQGSIWFI